MTRYFSISPRYLYIELVDSTMVLAQLIKEKTTFLVKNSTKTELKHLALFHGRIYNPTALLAAITSFMHKHNFKAPTGIIALPHAAKETQQYRLASTLQAALCIAKAGVKISHVLNTSLLNTPLHTQPRQCFSYEDIEKEENLFRSFMPPAMRSPQTWLATTAMILCVVLTSLSVIELHLRGRLHVLQEMQSKLSRILSKKRHQQKTLEKLSARNQYHRQHLARLTKQKEQTATIQAILGTIQDKLPPNTWLTTLKMQLPSQQILLNGYGADADALLTFVATLTQLPTLSSVRLAALEEKHATEESNAFSCSEEGIPKRFTFRITAAIIPPAIFHKQAL